MGHASDFFVGRGGEGELRGVEIALTLVGFIGENTVEILAGHVEELLRGVGK